MKKMVSFFLLLIIAITKKVNGKKRLHGYCCASTVLTGMNEGIATLSSPLARLIVVVNGARRLVSS